MQEELIEQISKVVQELHFDIRMEIAASYMSSNGINTDDIIITPKGLFNRKHQRDIQGITILETKSGKEYAQIKLNREGIYDSLPQAVTHSGKRGKGVMKTTGDMIEEVRLGREEEKAARLFFQPFENEFYQQLIDLEKEEQNILKGYASDSRYAKLFNEFWELPDMLSMRQKAMFIYMIPVIHKIVGDFYMTKLCYEAVLNVPLKIEIAGETAAEFGNPFSLGSTNQLLGISLICGNKFSDNKQSLQISIGPVSDDRLADFLPGRNGQMVLAFLNGYFLPADPNIRIRTIPSNNRRIHLSEQSQPCHLGYNLIL